MSIHIEKKAIRVLGIAESFREDQKMSTLAGVVIRSDLVIDGFGIEKLRVMGADGTKAAIRLFRKLRRNDVNSIMISGSVLSLYNILDLTEIQREIKVPVLALTFKDSKANLLANINKRFPPGVATKKVQLLEKLGVARKNRLKTGYNVYVRSAGINQTSCERLIDKFTLQGAIPEPIRIARLLAKSIAHAPPA